MGMAHVYDPYHDVRKAMKTYWTCPVGHEHVTQEGAQACVRMHCRERFGHRPRVITPTRTTENPES